MNLECVEELYELCLDESGQNSLEKLILTTKAAITKSCKANGKKGKLQY